MTMPGKSARRRVLASLVPAKAHDDLPLTDYETSSVLQLRRNQTPDTPICIDRHGHHICAPYRTNGGTFLHSADQQDAAVRPTDDQLDRTQQQWLDHQQERFDTQLTSPRHLQTHCNKRPEYRESTDNRAELIEAAAPSSYLTSSVIRQLNHIDQLLQMAGESLPTPSETPDYLVSTQCYAMALTQLEATIKALESRENTL